MSWRCLIIWAGVILFIVPGEVMAQVSGIAGVQNAIRGKEAAGAFQKDTSYIDLVNSLAHLYYGINSDSAFYYARKALDLSEKNGYFKGQSESWRMIGNTYEMIGDYPQMISSYHQALGMAEKIHSNLLIARIHSNLSLFYKDVGDYDAALAQMDSATAIYAQDRDNVQLAYVLNHKSDIFFRQQQYDKALELGFQALQAISAVKNEPTRAAFNNEIGRIFAAQGKYRQALEYYGQSYNYYNQADDKLGKAQTTNLLAQVYLLQKDYPNAIRYARQSLDLARSIKRKKEIKEAGKVLADIYEAKGDFRLALQYYKLYKDFSDSLFNEETRKQTFALETKYAYQKKEALMKEEAAKKDALHRHIVRNDTLKIFIAVLVIVFLLVLSLILNRSRRDKQRINLILQAKNREISRQKEEMEHQAVQLLLNNQQKDKLFSIIAHDLRGPLNSLKSLLDFLKENALSDAEIKAMMAELRRNVDYSAELVSNLLFWASSQLDGIVVNPVPLSMEQLTTDIMALFAKQAADKHIDLKNELPPDMFGFADKDMVQVVMRNLLSNAIKFCRREDSITVSGRMTGNAIEICVADTGIGMKKDLLEKISRKESVTTYGTAKEKGTGLGMLLCREFVEENDGRFWIVSEWGKGSQFYFTIPVAANSSSISV